MIQDFCKPVTLEEALRLKTEHRDYKFMAGGTEVNAKGYPGTPENIAGIISLSKLGLNKIEKENNRLIVSAMVTLQELIDSPALEAPFDILKTGASNVINRNIRNMATVGGNIAACKSCSDIIPVLLVTDALLEVYTLKGEKKEIPVEDYINSKRDCLITKIIIPYHKNFYTAISRYTRASNDLALINVCMGLEIIDGLCKDARLAIGGVAATPVRIRETEKFLSGREIKGNLQDFSPDLRRHVESHIHPIDDLRGKGWFKREMAGGLVLEALYKGAKKGGIEL